jgi:DNA-binding transcriptional MerR regulator
VENYFNYFTEIEEHFQRRRGGILLLSTLDWALIETWKDAGIPLQAALRGIDAAFDRYDQRPSKSKKVNSLAYCAQEVLAAAEDMKEAAVGAARDSSNEAGVDSTTGSTFAVASTAAASANRGFDPSEIAAYLRKNAEQLERARLPARASVAPETIARETANRLREIADQLAQPTRLEDLERRLTVLEEKLLAALLAATPDDELVAVRAQADRKLAPYRNKMPAAQIDQLLKQYIHKRLLEQYGLPRLSLFYM